MRPDRLSQELSPTDPDRLWVQAQAHRLFRARKAARLYQRQVAQRLGISRPCYSNLERGYTTLTARTAYQLSLIFGVQLQWLVSGQGPMWGVEGQEAGAVPGRLGR